MNRTERTLLAATVLVLAGGGVGWWVLRPTPGRPGPADVAGGGGAGVPGARPPSPIDPNPGGPPSDEGMGLASGMGAGLVGGPAGGVPSRLRDPSGENLSDPAHVKALLRENLAAENPRWDWIATLVGVLDGRLDPEFAHALQDELVHGNAAGALQVYDRLRDGTVVIDLLRVLDDPTATPDSRRAVLAALSRMPGADAAAVVTGIEGRLTNDLGHDIPYLQAIARRGGGEAARALAEAVVRSADPTAFTEDVWRELDLRGSPEASDALARALADPSHSPEATRTLAALAGRPGASAALVAALAALDGPDTKEPVRRMVLQSLARTGDDKAVARLLALASTPGADYGSVAAAAIAQTASATAEARVRLLEAAKTTADLNLRAQIVQALGNLREEKAVPPLTEWLASGDDALRKQSAVALGRIGPKAAGAVDALGKAFDGADEAMQGHVAVALGSIGTPEALSLLRQLALTNAPPRVKTAIGNAVAHIQSENR